MKKNINKKGFTLIETVLVVAIITIVTGVTIVSIGDSYSRYQTAAEQARNREFPEVMLLTKERVLHASNNTRIQMALEGSAAGGYAHGEGGSGDADIIGGGSGSETEASSETAASSETTVPSATTSATTTTTVTEATTTTTTAATTATSATTAATTAATNPGGSSAGSEYTIAGGNTTSNIPGCQNPSISQQNWGRNVVVATTNLPGGWSDGGTYSRVEIVIQCDGQVQGFNYVSNASQTTSGNTVTLTVTDPYQTNIGTAIYTSSGSAHVVSITRY